MKQEDDVIELFTDGLYEYSSDTCSVEYREDGENNTSITTRVDIVADSVTITKSGESFYQMILEKGIKHHSNLETGVGPLSMSSVAKKISADLSADGGSLELDYSLELNHAVTLNNSLTMKIYPRPELFPTA